MPVGAKMASTAPRCRCLHPSVIPLCTVPEFVYVTERIWDHFQNQVTRKHGDFHLFSPFTFSLGSSSLEKASCHGLKTLEQPHGETHVVRK